MQPLVNSVFVLALLSLPLSALAADAIMLGPQTNIRIVARGQMDNAQPLLTDLLERYLLKAMNRQKLDGQGETVTFLVESKAVYWHDVPRAEIKDISDIEAFEIEVAAKPESVVRITGVTCVAAGYGIMHFLENRLGITWAWPGDLGLCLPAVASFSIHAGREHVVPWFMGRTYTGFVYADMDLKKRFPIYTGVVNANRHFFTSFDYFKAVRPNFLASPSHNMINIFPPEIKDTVPDIFPVKDGKRWFPPAKETDASGRWQAWHPCYTNARTIEIAVQKAREAFQEQKAYCFSLGINDGYRVQCQCEECVKVGWPRSYYQFVAAVAERTKDFYPPHLIGLIAYGDVKYPPKDLVLPENVLVMCAAGGPERHLDWSKRARWLGTYEYFSGQGFWTPLFPLAAMKSNIAFYRQNNVRMYRSEFHPVWAFDAPRLYLYTRMILNPDTDADATLRRFCEAAFVEGGEPMRQFYLRWARLRDRDVVPRGASGLQGGDWPNELWRHPGNQFTECSLDDYAFAADCLARARGAVREEKTRKRIEMVEVFFEDSRALFEMNRFIRDAFDADAPPASPARITGALQLLGRHERMLDAMKAHPEWFVGVAQPLRPDDISSWNDLHLQALPHEFSNAMAAALVRLARAKAPMPSGLPDTFSRFLRPAAATPTTLHPRAVHPWYPDWGYVPLQSGKAEHAVTFKSATPADQRITEHPVLAGRRKAAWMAALATDVALSDRALCLVEMEARGVKGRLRYMVHLGANNRARGEADITDTFGDAERTVRRLLCLTPSNFDPQTHVNVPSKADAKGHVNIYLVWEPKDDAAAVQGMCRLTRLDFAEAGP